MCGKFDEFGQTNKPRKEGERQGSDGSVTTAAYTTSNRVGPIVLAGPAHVTMMMNKRVPISLSYMNWCLGLLPYGP